MDIKIPVYQPSLDDSEKKNVIECLDSTWISSKGRFINEFEQEFSKYTSVRHSVTVSNGTVALHLAMLALGIGDGDEVLVPTLTYIASVNAIKYTNATPVFVDSERETWQMSPEDVERKITSRTKAIMAVHLYGNSCDMEKICLIAKKYNLFVIEDCAEALGTKFKGHHVGSFGDISTFSFFGNKTITTGEGGMVVTNDETLYQRCLHFRGQGLAAHRQYWHDVVGYNYRMTNICAAIGLAQLSKIERFLTLKHQIALSYKNGLKGLPVEFHAPAPDVYHSYWMCSILVEYPSQRDELRAFLAEKGIETRPLFYPVHTMPMYSDKYQKHPVAEYIGWRGINLPSYPGLTDSELEFIIESIGGYYK